MRVEVDPGGVASGGSGFSSVGEALTTAAAAVSDALSSAAGAAGNGAVAGAASDLGGTLSTADRAAVLSVSGLGSAVTRAGDRYSSQEALICRGMGVP